MELNQPLTFWFQTSFLMSLQVSSSEQHCREKQAVEKANAGGKENKEGVITDIFYVIITNET